MMTKEDRENREVEEVLSYGIDIILKALARHCSDWRTCTACPYMNDSNGECNVLNHICDSEELTTVDTVSYGDCGYEEDPDPDRDWRDRDYD